MQLSPEEDQRTRAPRRRRGHRALVVLLVLGVGFTCALPAQASVVAARAGATPSASASASASGNPGSQLESAAARASDTGRKVAMSLIGLAFAVAAIVLSFRRDFKEAVGVFVVGIVAVLLATPAGVNLLRDTVTALFGAQ